MDLQSVKIDNDPVNLAITHPVTGEETDLVIKVIGVDSDDYKEVDRELTKLSLKKYSKAGKIDFSKVDFDEADRTKRKRLCALIKGWENLKEGGDDVKYSSEECMRVLKDYPFIAEQVEEFCTERANFIKGS